jgi:conjugal transfer ATP-binding protein TraC
MLQKNNQSQSLAEELPFWEFVESPRPHLILTDGSIVSGLKLSLIDIECFDDHEVNQLALRLRGTLNSISENTSVQFCLSVGSNYTDLLQKHHQRKSDIIHPLIANIAKFREEKLLEAQKDSVLYRPELTMYLRTKLVVPKKLNFLKKKEDFSGEAIKSYDETLELLFQNLDTLSSSLSSLGLKPRSLVDSEIKSHVYRFLNPKRSKAVPLPNIRTPKADNLDPDTLNELDWLAENSPREQLVFGDILLSSTEFTLDSHIHKVVTLKTLPEVTFAGMLSGFLRMPFHYDLILSFKIPAQADEMDKLQQKRKMAHSLAVTSGNRASDLESETKLSSTEELIRELLSSGQRIYAVQMSVILKANDTHDGAKRLNRELREVLSRFRSLQGAEGLEESVGAWKIFKGNLPAAPLNLERARKFKTNNLVDFLPLYGPREGDDDPVVIFRNRLNGLVSFNPFDSKLPNYNALVTGSSGAGKSFLNNCILVQELARGLRVFIIDIGGSYKKLTEALGGQYLEMDLSEQYQLNPFDIPDPKENPSDQKLKSLLAVIESMVVEDDKGKLSKLDRVLLEKSIIELYEEKRKLGKIPTLSDLMYKLSKSKESSLVEISKILFMWTGNRPYGKLLDGFGSLRTDAPILTFDLKGLSQYPDLQSVMILILTDFILAQIEKDKTNKKRIILDEAWQLLKSNAAAGFMEYCARTLRKTGSGITFITQGVEEIVESPIGPAIMNNTATKFILLQRGDSEILKNALKLNSQELNLIFSLEQNKGEYSEGLLIEGDDRQVIRIYPSPFEYWLSTSDANDNRHIQTLRESGLSLVEAIESSAKKFPRGIAQAKSQNEVK